MPVCTRFYVLAKNRYFGLRLISSHNCLMMIMIAGPCPTDNCSSTLLVQPLQRHCGRHYGGCEMGCCSADDMDCSVGSRLWNCHSY